MWTFSGDEERIPALDIQLDTIQCCVMDVICDILASWLLGIALNELMHFSDWYSKSYVCDVAGKSNLK